MTRKPTAQKTPAFTPVFKDLSTEEIESVLASHHVGRIAFSFHDRVDIRPIHYVFDERWLFGRTSPGDKLVTLRHSQWVAFEVDEVTGPFDWKSVIVHGSFHLLDPTGTSADSAIYERGMRAIKSLSLDALTENDPVPFRTELFGIAIDSVTGKTCSTK